MTTFLQMHLLTVYPPSNANRDDQDRPKSAFYGGVHRLRLSSQSLKRAARMSMTFQEALSGNLGVRTKRIGDRVQRHLEERDVPRDRAHEIALDVAGVFGNVDAVRRAGKDKGAPLPAVHTAQLAFLSPEEERHAMELAERMLVSKTVLTAKDLRRRVLRTADSAVDLAMFGRMLADAPDFNREAAVQIGHAITTHRADIEDDFFTAVDDLKTPSEDSGAGHLGEIAFGSGVFYLYTCVNCDLLVESLAGDRELSAVAIEALVEALSTSAPDGKQNSFAHRPRAAYVRAEAGTQQPRDLSGAFFEPVEGVNLLSASIEAMTDMADRIDACYGRTAEVVQTMDITKSEGSLSAIKALARATVIGGDRDD